MSDIFSMTGYGKGVAEQDGRKATVELKSVNHRFLDLGLKLPKSLMFAEDGLRKAIQKSISRGHIDLFISFDDDREKQQNAFKVDYDLAAKYVLAARELQGRCLIQNNFYVSEVMRMPDVITRETEEEEDEDFIARLVMQACAHALDSLNVMRRREGESLAKDLLAKLDNIEATIPKIEQLAPKTLEEYRDKLSARIKEYLQEVPLDEDKLLNEVAFFSDRICIDEEITRLHTHISHFKEILKDGGAVGKKLDFIVQEMNRETNTIGSKCNNAQITECVIFLKSEIEKMREQVQNLE
ncbi:MAG: YicC family protein [Clostridia bacterium]|jgi:uncharacterized protein (TIGR00255 family)|nr:YicC family protein [Clostridia bacterium]MCI9290835.1 YicC family protein [Clostridia bacterium]